MGVCHARTNKVIKVLHVILVYCVYRAVTPT